MAALRKFWLAHRKRNTSTHYFKSCIFQQIWREDCLSYTLGLLRCPSYMMQHISYLTRLLLDSLLSHRFDDALQCLVGLCGVCGRLPEMFWRVGCEVMCNRPGSYIHISQFTKSMFVICIPYQKELLLDFAMYLVKHNSDITEAQELLTAKLSDKSFQTSALLRAYCGLFAYLSWKKCKLQLEKRELDVEDLGGWIHEAEGTTATNLQRQMGFRGKQALALFGNLVENGGVWDIFVTKQVELLKYYNKSDEVKRILKRYKEKNAENPNAHRYLYYFLKSEGSEEQELCSILEGLLEVDPTSDLSEEYTKLRMQQTDQSKGLLDSLAVLFLKLDHAASQKCIKTWESFAEILQQYFTTQNENSFGELWGERADWWPRFHFRRDQVPDKDHVSEREWQLTRHKAEAATWLLGRGNAFSEEVSRQDKRGEVVEYSSAKSDTASSRKRKSAPIYSESRSLRKRKATHISGNYGAARRKIS